MFNLDLFVDESSFGMSQAIQKCIKLTTYPNIRNNFLGACCGGGGGMLVLLFFSLINIEHPVDMWQDTHPLIVTSLCAIEH